MSRPRLPQSHRRTERPEHAHHRGVQLVHTGQTAGDHGVSGVLREGYRAGEHTALDLGDLLRGVGRVLALGRGEQELALAARGEECVGGGGGGREHGDEPEACGAACDDAGVAVQDLALGDERDVVTHQVAEQGGVGDEGERLAYDVLSPDRGGRLGVHADPLGQAPQLAAAAERRLQRVHAARRGAGLGHVAPRLQATHQLARVLDEAEQLVAPHLRRQRLVPGLGRQRGHQRRLERRRHAVSQLDRKHVVRNSFMQFPRGAHAVELGNNLFKSGMRARLGAPRLAAARSATRRHHLIAETICSSF